MKKLIQSLLVTLGFVMFMVVPARAGEIAEGDLTEFQPNTAANAEEVNGNFSTVATEVNDNAQDITSHAGDADAHPTRYTDTEAQTAMGTKSNSNSLNHDRYTDTDAVSAMGSRTNSNSLNHSRYTDGEAQAANLSAIKANTTAISGKQNEVTGYCSAGSSIRVINANGTVSCETDNVGSADGHSLDGQDGTIVDALFVDDEGNVGIGTERPNYKLTVNDGTIHASNTTTGPYAIRASYYVTTDPGYMSHAGAFSNVATGEGSKVGVSGFSQGANGTNYGAYLRAINGDSNYGLWVDGGTSYFKDDVGIGISNPLYELHVNGVVAGMGFVNISSRDYKEDIKKVTDSKSAAMLARLMEVELTTYKYKKEFGGDGSTKLGFIAEEMPEEVLSKDGKGVDTYELLAFTIGAMKEQQAQIDALKKEIKELKE